MECMHVLCLCRVREKDKFRDHGKVPKNTDRKKRTSNAKVSSIQEACLWIVSGRFCRYRQIDAGAKDGFCNAVHGVGNLAGARRLEPATAKSCRESGFSWCREEREAEQRSRGGELNSSVSRCLELRAARTSPLFCVRPSDPDGPTNAPLY